MVMYKELPAGHVRLLDWNIIVLDLPNENLTEIFVGYSQTDLIGRVSTPIQEFDIKTGQGKTKSGSIYEVIGEPGKPHDDAIYVLERIIGLDLVQKELFVDPYKGKIRFKYPI
ncbi:hypothetical protein LCGC14_0329120 [marine sediment metagenome]|uniref:Uncharacterized protein n=2 Tax=root TaxID=1 RepID=A0A0F9TZM4_9ZZZZ